MDFDEVEMDMIRRGDMLGPKLGAKVATALETLQRERDEAVEQERCAIDAFESMQQNRDTLQRHFNDCTIRAETAERERDEAREANEALMAERTGLIETKRQQLAAMEKERDAWRKAAVEAVIPLEALNIAGQGHLPDASWGEIRSGILAVRSTIEQFRPLSPKEAEE